MRKGMKKTFIVVLLSMLVFNGLTLPGIAAEGKTKAKFNQLQPQQFQLKINDGQIILTADLDERYRQYRNFVLKIGQNEKKFNWRSIGSISFAPSMRTLDLGEDKNSGICVFLVASQGTGTFVQNAHVIRINDFNEIPIESPLGIIRKHVKTQSTDDGIIIAIDDNKAMLNKDYLNHLGINNPNQKLYYEYHIVYGTRNNSLSVDVGVCNENLNYVGNIHIDYTYKDNSFTMASMRFQKLR